MANWPRSGIALRDQSTDRRRCRTVTRHPPHLALQKGGTLTTDVAIGVIFTAALAIGTLVTPSEDLIEALFGGFQN